MLCCAWDGAARGPQRADSTRRGRLFQRVTSFPRWAGNLVAAGNTCSTSTLMATAPGRVFIFLFGGLFVGPYVYAMLMMTWGIFLSMRPSGQVLSKAWRERREARAQKEPKQKRR